MVTYTFGPSVLNAGSQVFNRGRRHQRSFSNFGARPSASPGVPAGPVSLSARLRQTGLDEPRKVRTLLRRPTIPVGHLDDARPAVQMATLLILDL